MPLSVALIECSCRYNQMDMWMVIEIAFMGVEYSMGTTTAPQLWVAACKTLDCLPGSFEQQIVGNSLMSPEQSPQLYRYCEGQHEIINGKKFLDYP